ncbi:MAG: hypothetical protein U5R49_25345 [Deltaproteobacteria bacterium]|nr:hypothetical protein [Deltaproteobacteria bacterium]
MGRIGKASVLAGLGLTALVLFNPASGRAVPSNPEQYNSGQCIMAESSAQAPQDGILLARGGKGSGGTKWSKSNNSGESGGYGVQDGSGAAPRPGWNRVWC